MDIDLTERLLVLVILFFLLGVPAGVTWMKGHHAAFWIGFLALGIVWWVAACRLARPTSYWAQRFYGPGKLDRARRRFGEESLFSSMS